MNESSADSGHHDADTDSRLGSTAVHDEQGEAEENRQPAALPARLTFRITRLSIIGVLTVAVCVSPAAAAAPWLLWLYILPLGLLVWVLRVRTTVDTGGLVARTAVRTFRIGWDELRSLRINERRWVRAVLHSGREIRLPAVRVRDLPRLAAMSDDRISDPTAEPEHEPAKTPD
ncbi:PH (Pleckstrin Homology) domain-containing protein [Halopolyspora algeriensis]|uniref:PH (Pleckstrin Homology) domain-containing protein n=1 Tax=Halopolyspora algeriensis TaxID=1500506 RepID=A0A368VCX7_9ACTN|nr:PH domain-containing protein [Halopolyspora algeriensis]RCW39137.1 PH (Pleckstrin Homology) domain-containing protein [Halopolyspora algeriensis]TQM56566.1 PH (Pleckstrin Homology) domain-containing protein [Halopolyspora algeriensis]